MEFFFFFKNFSGLIVSILYIFSDVHFTEYVFATTQMMTFGLLSDCKGHHNLVSTLTNDTISKVLSYSFSDMFNFSMLC